MRAPPQMQVGSNQVSGNTTTNTNSRDDFSEYMWMEDMESFDKQVLAELEEEAELEMVMEEMLAEEEARETIYFGNVSQTQMMNSVNELAPISVVNYLTDHLNSLALGEDILLVSKLNPDAAEFVPRKTLNDSSDLSDSSEASDR